MTTPDKDQVTSSTPEPEEAAPAAASPADGTAPAEVIADAEVIEANESGQLDEELEKAAGSCGQRDRGVRGRGRRQGRSG